MGYTAFLLMVINILSKILGFFRSRRTAPRRVRRPWPGPAPCSCWPCVSQIAADERASSRRRTRAPCTQWVRVPELRLALRAVE